MLALENNKTWDVVEIDGKIPNLSTSQPHIRLGTCKNILCFSKSYAQQKKISFLNFIWI